MRASLLSAAGGSISGMRKDGRPLVTEFPVTAMDMIEYHPPRGPAPPTSENATMCRRRTPRVRDTAWMDEGIDVDDEELWLP